MIGISATTIRPTAPHGGRRPLRPTVLGSLAVAAGVVLLVASALLVTRQAAPVAAPTSGVLEATNGLVTFWEQRIAADPHDTTAYNHLADGYLRRARQTGDVADYDRAEIALRASLRELPNANPDAMLRLAAVRGAKHEFRDSLGIVNEALRQAPDEPYGLGVLGDDQFALGQYEEAAATYASLLRIAPGLSANARQANIDELRGDLTRAGYAWQNALASDTRMRPEDTAWANTEFGNFRLLHGDLNAADEAYTTALSAYPSYVNALAGRAGVHAARGDYAEAARLYAAVAQRYPAPQYVIALGDVYTAMGKHDDARRQYALVRVIDRLYRSSGVNTDLQMALFYADQNTDLDEALRVARAAEADRPGIDADDALAWVLYRRGDLTEARAHAEHALRYGTQNPLFLFHAGMIAAAQHDTAAARAHLDGALKANPTFNILRVPEAKATLKQLGGAQ